MPKRKKNKKLDKKRGRKKSVWDAHVKHGDKRYKFSRGATTKKEARKNALSFKKNFPNHSMIIRHHSKGTGGLTVDSHSTRKYRWAVYKRKIKQKR